MKYTDLITKYINLLKKQEFLYADDELIEFTGSFKEEPDFELIEEVANSTGLDMPKEITYFLSMFGGCTFFINGVEIEFYKIDVLEKVNKELEEYPGQFFPKFIILAHDYAGDFLVLHQTHTGWHFGNLDHAAWGEVDCWASNAISFVKFTDWLNMLLLEPTESTIPNKSIKYEI